MESAHANTREIISRERRPLFCALRRLAVASALAVVIALALAGCTLQAKSAQDTRLLASIPPSPTAPSDRALPSVSSTIPPPQGTRLSQSDSDGLFAVSFVDAAHGWLADGDALLSTSDGGQRWVQIYKANSTISSLSFVSMRQGWATTGTGLIGTQDGGTTWKPAITTADVRLYRAYNMYHVDFVDRDHGWVISEQNNDAYDLHSILHTEDGGKTWAPVSDPCTQFWGYGPFSFVSPSAGFILCGYEPAMGHEMKTLLKTTDAGRTWGRVADTGADFPSPYSPDKLNFGGHVGDLFFLDSTNGWFSSSYNSGGSLQTTTDGGQSWRYIDVGQAPGVEGHMRFLSTNLGYILYVIGGPYALQRYSALLSTRDRGTSWTQLYPAISPIGLTHFLDGKTGFGTSTLLDRGAILKTDDGGRSWTQVGALTGWCDASGGSCEGGCDGQIISLHFTDALRGSVLTECGRAESSVRTTYATTDGGATWKISPPSLLDVK